MESNFQLDLSASAPPLDPSPSRVSSIFNTSPPQIFGGYNSDGSPIPPNLGDPIFTADQALFSADDASNEAKRRRIARACDMCRKKKIKCDGKMPACTHCINYKTECIFTQVEKKRSPPKGAKYIEGLENRLGRMESLLRLSGLLSEEDGKTDLGTLEKRLAEKQDSASPASHTTKRSSSAHQHTPPEIPPDSSTRNGSIASPKGAVTPQEGKKKETEETEEEIEALSDMMCSLVTNSSGETRYFGSSSGFSIFSPKGIQWVNDKTGDSSFQSMVATAAEDDNKWIHWKPEIFSDIFIRRVFKPLPPKHEALSLLKDYFDNFNCMFPLFHEPTFMHLVEMHYSNDPYEGSGWWASLNTALAIAHRLRVMSNVVPHEEDQKAWGYLKNALGVLTELTMRNTDLLSVQALLGMSLFLQGTPNPQPSFFLVAAAIRLSHSIGLHKRGSGFNLRPAEIEQRKRVFWIAYMVDKDICLRSGRPPAQDDDDMNVELPSEDPADDIGNIPLAEGGGKINLFRLMCSFAIIESKVYKQLYSTKASRQSDGALLNTIGELDHELEEWKDGIPIEFRPEHEIKASHTPLILHIVVLHFAYYNCLTTIHRMSVHHGYWTSRLSNYAIKGLNARPLNPRVFSSAALCVSAARASIHLIKYIPQGDYACVWLILYFPVSSLVTLFANILQNPQDARARSDVRLMNVVVNFLSMLNNDDEPGGVRRMLGVCAEFERIAKVVLDKAEKESSSRRKRKNNSDGQKLQQAAAAGKERGHARTDSLPATNVFTSDPQLDLDNQALASSLGVFAQNGDLSWMNDLGGADAPGFFGPSTGLSPRPFDNPQYTDGVAPPLNVGSFQQPFVPQDLWQMPMTLEWDWADMTGTGASPFNYGGGQQANGQQPNGQP
ncbi:MAG: hypothetical protein M1817_004830 [Caeruleum heppii]|nr:MAG: hypothetical protein M1817_004830 [Caeruleum heppii]